MSSQDSQSSLTLYGFVTCPYVIRVRMALEELNVPFSYHEIDLLRDQQLSESFLKINPLHKVPVLIPSQGPFVSESLVCLEYINDKYAKGALLPESPEEAAFVRKWICYYSDTIDALKWKVLPAIRKRQTKEGLELLRKIQGSLKFMAKSIGLVERAQKESINYLFGRKISLGDFAILPVLHQMIILFKSVFSIDLLKDNLDGKDQEALNSLEQWFKNSIERPSYQRITIKLVDIPQNPLVDELQLRKDWNFEKYYLGFAARKFFQNPILPKL